MLIQVGLIIALLAPCVNGGKGECYLQNKFQTARPSSVSPISESALVQEDLPHFGRPQLDLGRLHAYRQAGVDVVAPILSPPPSDGTELVWRVPDSETETQQLLQASDDCFSSAVRPAIRPSDLQESAGGQAFGAKFVALADHIYVLCMKCTGVTIPREWLQKITLVDGSAIDKCLSSVFPSDYSSNEESYMDTFGGIRVSLPRKPSWIVHGIKVTWAHKFIIADALAKNYSNVAMLEGDFSLSDSARNWSENDFDSMKKFYDASDWQILRIGFYAMGVHDGHGNCKCNCVLEPGHHRLCKVAAGCQHIHSSAGYILPRKNFNTFLRADGIIDVEVLARFESTLVIPSMLHQKSGNYMQIESDSEHKYLQDCVMNGSNRAAWS